MMINFYDRATIRKDERVSIVSQKVIELLFSHLFLYIRLIWHFGFDIGH